MDREKSPQAVILIMQLKKQNWLKRRAERPCAICGKDHETRQCVTRRGGRREIEPPTYGNQLFTIAN